MSFDLLLTNFLNPPILFFFLGIAAVLVKSDLDIPQPLPKAFSLYLLFAIGFKGGVELAHGGLQPGVLKALGAAIGLACVVPVYAFFVLRRRLDVKNAAAIAATYGSISAVTFIAATSFLDQLGVVPGGYMVAAMALMESPAIIVGVALCRLYSAAETGGSSHQSLSWSRLLREAFFNGSVFVLVGSLIIGAATGARGAQALQPFTEGIFKGVLCLFLLDMGLVSARRLAGLRKLGAFPLAFATLIPLVNAALALLVAKSIGLPKGDAFLLCTLSASASYIAVPAAMRAAIPEANPGLYVTMALALTFPFNVILGFPLYYSVIQRLWP